MIFGNFIQSRYLVLIYSTLLLTSGCSTKAYITSQPSGASVSINGKRAGSTPTSINLNLINRIYRGPENIVISKAGYMPSIRIVGPFDFPPSQIHSALSPTTKPIQFQSSEKHSFSDNYAEHPYRRSTAAVLEFDTRSNISNDEVALLADRFTTELNRTGVFILTSKSKMKEIVELQNASIDCSSSECAIELGRLLSVQYMIYGSVGKIGSIYTVNASIVSVESSRVVSSTSMDFKSGAEEVLTQGMFKVVQSLLAASVNDAG